MLRWNTMIVTPRDGLRTVNSYLDPCFVFTLSLEIASLEIFFMGCSPLLQCSLAVRLAPLFCQGAPQCSTVLMPALLCGWSSSSAPILLVRLSVSFPMSSSGYSFNTLDYSDRQLACSQLEVSFARASSMSDHFCPSFVVYLLCG